VHQADLAVEATAVLQQIYSTDDDHVKEGVAATLRLVGTTRLP